MEKQLRALQSQEGLPFTGLDGIKYYAYYCYSKFIKTNVLIIYNSQPGEKVQEVWPMSEIELENWLMQGVWG